MPIPLTTTTQLLVSLTGIDDDGAWDMLVERYEPVLVGVARRLGLTDPDSADAAQQTLLELVRDVRGGNFDRTRGQLRVWALAILRNRVRDIRRLQRRGATGDAPGPESLDELEAPKVLEALWEEQLERHVLATALQRLRERTRIADTTLRAFELTVLRGVPIDAAARECNVSVDDVYMARNRVATRLRAIVRELDEQYQDDLP